MSAVRDERGESMLILPAIDLRGGQCVRLRQGDYSQETVFGDDPAAMARRWVDEGARALHLVDLDGAKAGRPVNGDVIRRIVEAVRRAVPARRRPAHRGRHRATPGWGVARVVLGTRALQDPAWVAADGPGTSRADRARHRRPRRQGRHARLAGHVRGVGPRPGPRVRATGRSSAIVYTDITRDGMLGGPNIEALAELAAAVPLPVIASGGVTTLDDVRDLMTRKLSGCIIGRALYEGRSIYQRFSN